MKKVANNWLWCTVFLALFLCSCGEEGRESSLAGGVQTEEDGEILEIPEFIRFESVLAQLDDWILTGCDQCMMNIEKRPAGYYLSIKNYEGEELYNSIIWDVATRTFTKPDIQAFLLNTSAYFDEPLEDATQKETILRANNVNGIRAMRNKADSYDFHLFFGYSGAHQDIIRYVKSQPNKTPNDLEQLARAYDFLASNCISPGQFGQTPDFAKKWEKHESDIKVTEEQIALFTNYADSSLFYYEAIMASEPQYNTFIIGPIDLKLNNNLMHYWNLLISHDKEELAGKYLNQANYSKQYEIYGKQYLLNCPAKGVLFTHGDSDTYPVWYVQEKLGYRTDVAVLNKSLLGAQWFVNHSITKHDLTVSLDWKTIFEKSIMQFFFNSSNPESISLDSMILELNKKIQLNLEKPYLELEFGRNLTLHYSQGEVSYLEKNNFLLLMDLLQLVITNDNRERPVLCAAEIGFRGFDQDHVASRFFAFQLSPREEQDLQSLSAYVEKFVHPQLLDHLGNMDRRFVRAFLFRLYSVDREIDRENIPDADWNGYIANLDEVVSLKSLIEDQLFGICYLRLDPSEDYTSLNKAEFIEGLSHYADNLQLSLDHWGQDNDRISSFLTLIGHMYEVKLPNSKMALLIEDKLVIDLAEKVVAATEELMKEAEEQNMKWTKKQIQKVHDKATKVVENATEQSEIISAADEMFSEIQKLKGSEENCREVVDSENIEELSYEISTTASECILENDLMYRTLTLDGFEYSSECVFYYKNDKLFLASFWDGDSNGERQIRIYYDGNEDAIRYSSALDTDGYDMSRFIMVDVWQKLTNLNTMLIE
jgi:hypothetical protein